MKYLFLFFFISKVFAVQPVVEVNELPTDEQLEAYELTEEIFSIKVMEYYNDALILKTQLELLGEEPIEKLSEPSYEELTDLELDVIVKYYNIAKSYETQVLNSTGMTQKEEIIWLKKEMIGMKLSYMDSLWDVKNSYLERELRVKKISDSLCNERIRQIEESLEMGCPDCVNYFSVAVTQNLFLPDSDGRLMTEPNLGFKLYLNAIKLFGFGKSVEFWYEYQVPRITSEVNVGGVQQDLRWNTNLSAVGISGEFFPLIEFKKFKNGLKAGLGYFWTDGTIYNRENDFFSWEGLKIDLEYFGGLADSKYPFEVFLGVNIYQSVGDELQFVFNDGSSFELGNTHAGIYAGIRYNFWSSPF